MEVKGNPDPFDDFFFNYAVVTYGRLSDLQELKSLIEKCPGITIRYQTLDRGRITIQKED
jgi:hypothetical protein